MAKFTVKAHPDRPRDEVVIPSTEENFTGFVLIVNGTRYGINAYNDGTFRIIDGWNEEITAERFTGMVHAGIEVGKRDKV